MKYSTVLSLTAVFTGYVLADAPPTCKTTGDNIPIKSSCCPRNPAAKRLRRSAREIFARTDAPTCETPKFYGDSCCTHEFAKPTLDKGTFNLQCGANGVADIVNDAVKVEIIGCDSADDLDKDTCILKISSTPASSIKDTHLEISTSPWTADNYPDQAPSKWSYTSYCVAKTGVCQVPLNKIGGASALCDKPLYIAYHAATSEGKTCTGDGSLIPGQPGKRWWEYLTLDFKCPKVCDGWCCCEKPVVEPPPTETKVCDIGTAFGYGTGAKTLNGDDGGSAVCKNANRWGWYFETSATSLSGKLIVGAGGNDLEKGTVVGTWSSEKTGSDITVTYTLYDDNTNGHFDLSSVHVQASCDKPTTCAPGQFTFTDDNLSGSSDTSYTKTFKIDGGSCSTYYLIFHASVNQKVPETETCPTKAE